MNAGWRLGLNIAAWAASMPVLNVTLRALEERRVLSITGHTAAAVALGLALWACWIYWRCVPSTPQIGRRLAYLAAHLVVMGLVAAAALWATFWISVAVFGL